MKRICVYSGSNPGLHPDYEAAALALGQEMANRGYDLIFGGSQVGLMGRIANKIMECEGEAIGVIPRGLFRGEVAHPNLTKLHEVGTMHERKAMMSDLSDGFIAMPGGLGTFEELFEIACWAQLGIHQKPIGLLNTRGFYDPLVAMLKHAVQEGFMKATNLQLLIIDSDPAQLLEKMEHYTPVVQEAKWSELEPKA